MFFLRLAKDFLAKLSCKQPEGRYIAEQALKHPWITRDFQSNIPLTFEEKYHLFLKENETLNVKNLKIKKILNNSIEI